ncbi:uncharacterized protein PG998_012777 [Apiospora kogelbergensis]|uniref:Uncharacterized protein n=1 Tax=Apiospora kogelbergensis TaxID=1337665 RepID=A0AAW0QBQ0_9PEZI
MMPSWNGMPMVKLWGEGKRRRAFGLPDPVRGLLWVYRHEVVRFLVVVVLNQDLSPCRLVSDLLELVLVSRLGSDVAPFDDGDATERSIGSEQRVQQLVRPGMLKHGLAIGIFVARIVRVYARCRYVDVRLGGFAEGTSIGGQRGWLFVVGMSILNGRVYPSTVLCPAGVRHQPRFHEVGYPDSLFGSDDNGRAAMDTPYHLVERLGAEVVIFGDGFVFLPWKVFGGGVFQVLDHVFVDVLDIGRRHQVPLLQRSDSIVFECGSGSKRGNHLFGYGSLGAGVAQTPFTALGTAYVVGTGTG